ncbi:MAG: response regulator transcription factor [Ruminococcaceae bacterium]|nr:response regulator transcription factor [Oscillospiraceae bacterium]
MIFILEDDNSIRDLSLYALNGSGLDARGFENPADFWAALEQQIPDLLLLDVMLPGEDGISILRKLRARDDTRALPIIMLTARSSEYDKVVGLDNGADDYVTKPFGMLELISRIKALLRRSAAPAAKPEQPGIFTVGDLYVSQPGYIVRAAGEDVTLTLKEFELLCLLLRNRGIVLNRSQILSHIWGYDFTGESRTVDVHIRTLRTKLGPCGALIETIRGIGYKIG